MKDDRRQKGQFYTPHHVAKRAWKKICGVLGSHFWADGTWRIWDNSAGSGNLEYKVIQKDALAYLYLSTINIAEVESLQSNDYFKNRCAGIFQFDWLNDRHSKLPEQLRDDLENENLNWLFFINPPYAEATGYTASQKKQGVKFSSIAEEMKNSHLGKCANELTFQFLYRIERDFSKRGYYLGLFSKAKWITKPSTEKFRKIWNPAFDGGFMLNAGEHFIVQKDAKFELRARGTFPVIFSLLDRREKTESRQQEQTYEVIDAAMNPAGYKTFISYNETRLCYRDYFFTPVKSERTKLLPVMGSAVVPSIGKRRSDQVPPDCAGTLMFLTSDFQSQTKCFFSSGLAQNHEVFITPANRQSVLTGFALYKSVKYDWKKDADLFYAPKRDLTKTETADCLLYALLCPANNTATTRVNGEILSNWFNPFDKEKFDFSYCSKIGKKTFAELSDYCENIVNWQQLETPYGQGVWLGLYQYRTPFERVNKTYKRKVGKDYPNKDLYGIAYPDSFQKAIEVLRQHTEALAIELCLSPNTAPQNTMTNEQPPET